MASQTCREGLFDGFQTGSGQTGSSQLSPYTGPSAGTEVARLRSLVPSGLVKTHLCVCTSAAALPAAPTRCSRRVRAASALRPRRVRAASAPPPAQSPPLAYSAGFCRTPAIP